ncbi:hypothetical protein M0804_004998 [Polistes exclamans]|nr:hypothetical protein M0804_004998 [Polistes exclamans]
MTHTDRIELHFLLCFILETIEYETVEKGERWGLEIVGGQAAAAVIAAAAAAGKFGLLKYKRMKKSH